MANPTVKGNLKLIDDMQENQVAIAEELSSLIKKIRQDQIVIAEGVSRLLDVMMEEGTVSRMLTYRGKWKGLQTKLKEIADAENTEGRRDREDSDTD